MIRQIINRACLILLFYSCQKQDGINKPDFVQRYLHDNLASSDYKNIDWNKTSTVEYSSAHLSRRIGFKDKDILHDFIIVDYDRNYTIDTALFFHIDGNIMHRDGNGKPVFNGDIETSPLMRENKSASTIVNGFVMSLHIQRIPFAKIVFTNPEDNFYEI